MIGLALATLLAFTVPPESSIVGAVPGECPNGRTMVQIGYDTAGTGTIDRVTIEWDGEDPTLLLRYQDDSLVGAELGSGRKLTPHELLSEYPSPCTLPSNPRGPRA